MPLGVLLFSPVCGCTNARAIGMIVERGHRVSFFVFLALILFMVYNTAMGLNKQQRTQFRALISKLEALRQALTWSENDMAQLCGVSQPTYHRWCAQDNEPNPLALEGLQARMPQIIAELKTSQARIEKTLSELANLRKR